MLAVTTYDPNYINHCRSLLDAQLAAYDALAAGARRSDVAAFERLLFAHLVVVLDAYFMHRMRGREGKDGNPINEVRMVADSILHHGGVLAADKTIKYRPDAGVLHLEIGEEIRLERKGFGRLADAYFAEIEARFC